MSDPFVLSRCLIGLAALGLIWFLLLGQLRRDNFRTKIRAIRDDLFDFMWMNGHDFSTPAYCEARQMLNSIIYLAGVFTPGMFLLHGILILVRTLPSRELAIESMEECALKEKLEQAQAQAVLQVIHFLFLQGLLGMLLRLLFLGLRAKTWATNAIRNLIWAVEANSIHHHPQVTVG